MLHKIYNAEPVAPIIEIPRLDCVFFSVFKTHVYAEPIHWNGWGIHIGHSLMLYQCSSHLFPFSMNDDDGKTIFNV